MRKFIAFGPALVVLVTALVTLVAAPAAVRYIGYASTDVNIQLARQNLEQDNILKQIDKAVRNIADAVEPSVVHIGIEEPTNFGTWVRASQGSGWVYDQQGHIVTNSHVVRGASRIVVQFYDGRAVEAQLVGQDRSTDIAVIKVGSTEGLFPSQRATGLNLHQGDRVYAFGSPFGFKFSMSEGIVSGLGRDPGLSAGSGYTNFIQTDAAVNPGNSGGPLVNVEGKVVGMNVAIATAQTQGRRGGGEMTGGQNSGISFAIPLDTIERVVDQLIGGGVVSRGYLGINHPLNDDINTAELNRLGFRGRGVLVGGVQTGGPADKAGLKQGDIITKLNGQSVTGVAVLRSAIANNSPGDKVNVEYVRNGETSALMVELGRLIADADRVEAAKVAALFGINDIAETGDGQVYVTEVRAPSPAYQAGLRPNMRIVDVDGAAVSGIEGFFTALAAGGLHQGREVGVTVESRNGRDRKTLKISSK